MDGIEVIHGDCLGLMPTLETGSVALIVADPPYGIGYHSNHYIGKNPHAPVTNDWNFQPGRFFSEAHRVLKDGGALYVFCRWDVQPLWVPYLSGGLKLKNVIVWVKDNWSAGDLDGNFGNQYETLLFATKGRHKRRGRRWSNVWEFPRVSHTKMVHPTQKPTALIERAVIASSDPGDLVLDPYAGSGSTGEACRNTDRLCVLMDVDPKMIAIACRRLGIDPPSLPAIQEDMGRPTASLEIPSPAEWGMHPEDLRAIYDAIRGNALAMSPKARDAATPIFDALTSGAPLL